MTSKVAFILALALSVAAAGLVSVSSATALGDQAAQDTASPSAIARRIGAIKAINGNSITLAPTTGPEVAVTVQPNARIVRIAPGEKDLKNATPVQLQDLQVGDTIRARGTASDDGKSIAALEIVVITSSTIQAVSQQIQQDWQKRGLAGPVTAVDSAAGTVTVSLSSLGGKRTITIHASKSTVVRRYAPDSAKFEDAKPSTLPEIHVGDQLRARGDRSADGSELTAEEIVTGNFPNFAGLIKSVDASAGTMSLQDLASKKTVQLKITADSQLHKIPTEMANGFAARLKAAMPPERQAQPRIPLQSRPPGRADRSRPVARHPVLRARGLEERAGAERRAADAPVEDSTSNVCWTKRRQWHWPISTRETLWLFLPPRERSPAEVPLLSCLAEWSRSFRLLPMAARP